MKLRTKEAEGKCDAARCRQEPTGAHWGDDGVHKFCARHLIEAERESKKADLHASLEAGAMERLTEAGTPAELDPVSRIKAIQSQLKEMRKSAPVLALLNEAKEQEEALALVREMDVEDQESFAFAEDLLADAKRQKKEYEAKRTEYTKPANAILREFNSWFKPVTTVLDSIKVALETKLRGYRAKQEQVKQELLLSGDFVEAAEAQPEESATYIDRWVWEVTDAAKIPREFLTPDVAKLNTRVKSLKGDTDIPGIRVWNDPIVRS